MSPALPKSEYYIRNDAITLIQGSDSLAVLDRLITTRIDDMQDLARRGALFCDYNGRISDLASVFTISGSILLSSAVSECDETRRKLVDGRSWDEDCEIMVADKAIFCISVFPNDFEQVKNIFGVDLEGSPPDILFESDEHLFVKSVTHDGIFFDILVKFENLDNIISSLSKFGFSEMDSIGWNNARILLGLRQMCDSAGRLPDEIGFASLVSKDKGCYPGQEIHARLDSRGRKIKSLCRITGDSPIDLGKHKTDDFGNISITSATYLDGIASAFALIRLEGNSPGSIEIKDNSYTIDVMGYP